ncbi:MAG TPA: hypothetical protein VMI53_06700 [Opitutaceae bacterium]|nr:hypothetical protein [Opitutaceae bacterium]
MLTSRRDYLLRIIDEVSAFLARVIFQRNKGNLQDALQSVVQGCERLFSMDAERLFQFTPDQHFTMLTLDEPPDIARDKVLLYAALNAEAGKIYAALGNRPMARGSYLNALRFALKAKTAYPTAAASLPAYAPRMPDLLDALKDAPLDADTAELLREAEAAG